MEAVRHHQHGDEDGRQDPPFGGAGTHDQIDETHEQDKEHRQRKAVKGDIVDQPRPADGHQLVDVGPDKEGLKLAAEKAKSDKTAHGGQLLDYGRRQIPGPGKDAGRKTVGDAGNHEKEKEQRHQIVQQVRTHKTAAAFIRLNESQRSPNGEGRYRQQVEKQSQAGLL